MSVFDYAKSKVAQGTNAAASARGVIGQVGEGASNIASSGLGAVLDNPIVKNGLNAVNQVQGLVSGVQGLISSARSFLADPYQVVPNPLLGGYSRQEVRKLANRAASTYYAKNNLFLVRFGDKNYPLRKPKGVTNNFENGLPDEVRESWDLLAMGVSFTPIAITGDTVKLGMLQGDSIQQSERVEIRMTFFDNTIGTIKRYLSEKKKQMVNKDGTGNPPSSYVLDILIIHLDQSVGRTFIGGKAIGVYNEDDLVDGSYTQHRYQVRVSNLEIDLNKREDSLQELQVTFTEVDPFMMLDRGQDGS